MNNWKKILNELSYRVSSGIPDLTNEQHLLKLWDILKEEKWPINARVELLKNLQEKIGKVYVQKGKGPSGVNLQVGPRGGKYYMGNTETGEPAPESKKDVNIAKNTNVKDFEDRITKSQFLNDEQKKLGKKSIEKMDMIYDENASPEQKKEAVDWLIENMKMSTNANKKKVYFNVFGGERKVISGNSGTSKSKDLIQRVEKILGEPLETKDFKSVTQKITTAAKPDLGSENIVKHPFKNKYLQDLHKKNPLNKIRENNTGIFAVLDESGEPKLPSSKYSKEYLRQSFDNPSLKKTIEVVDEEVKKGNIDPGVGKSLKTHQAELERIYNEMKIPSEESSQAILESYNKLMVDMNNADSDMVGAIMKQQAEMALYQSELAKGEEVYLPSSGTFPVGDKIKNGGDEMESVALISCKYGKQGRIHGCPANSKTICEIHQDESKRNNQGQYIGEKGYTMLINDDLVIGKDRNETAQKTENFITEKLDEVDLGNTFSSDDKKKISSIAADYTTELQKIQKELESMNLSPSDYYKLQAERMESVDEKYGKLMSESVSDEQIGSLIGENNAGNLRRSSKINPAEMLSAIEISNNIRTNETLESTEHNKQYFDKDAKPVFKTQKGTRNPNDWSITFRSKRTAGRSGGGTQLSFTGDGGERPESIITQDGTIENVKTGKEEFEA